MTASDWNWLLTMVGSIASLVGAFVSWLAWAQAKGAKKAAEEAAQGVRTRETAYDFSKMASDAKRLLEAVQSRQKDKAIFAATDLAHLLMIAKDRRASDLPVGFSSELCIENLQRIGTSLTSTGFPEVGTDLEKFLSRCHQIHGSLCGIAGSVGRTQEETER